jgi:hypothetical protein
MYRPWLERVRAEASGTRALESVHAIARFHRVQASPGYDDAAAWVGRQLETAGLEPEWAYVPADGRSRALGILMPRGWTCGHARAHLVAGTRREPLCDAAAEPLSVILRSAPVKGSFPIVRIDDGTEPRHYEGIDVRGRVVLTAGPVHRVHDLAVIERGAAGLLSFGRRLFPPVRSAADDADALPYTSVWWGPAMPRGWGFVVSPAAGERLAARLSAGETLALEADIESSEFDTTIPLLSASIPGETDREVLIVSHLCHPQPSANDNASGAAALLETARVLSRLRKTGAWKPGALGVRFLWMPELSGTCAWLALDRHRAGRVAAALNLDMVGEDQAKCGSTLLIEDPPCFSASFAEPLLQAIRHDAQDWIMSFSGAGHYSLARMARVPYSGGSDHAVLTDPMVGIPCPMLIQWPDRYYHSSHDTPDKCDPESLALAVRCAATYAATLSSLDSAGARGLLDLVGRDARRRVIDATDHPGAGRSLAAARLGGRTAIQSVSRVLDEPARVAAALALFDEFCRREAGGAAADPVAPGLRAEASPAARCPRRTLAGPLEFMTHLWPGQEDMSPESRRGFLALIDALPGGRSTLDLAWAACDGRRSLEEIAALVELETGFAVPVTAVGEGPDWEKVFGQLETVGLVSGDPGTVAGWSLDTPDGGRS